MDNEIKLVTKVLRDKGEFMVDCPHCHTLLGIEGDSVEDVAGGQYLHPACQQWIEVSDSPVVGKYSGW